MGCVFQPPPFHSHRPALVAPVRIDPTGNRGPTRKQARGPRWRRSSHGFYVPAGVDPGGAQQRIVEASAVLREGDAVTGWAALNWVGGRWFGGMAADGTTPVDVGLVSPGHLRGQPGFQVSQEYAPPRDIVLVDGIPVTTPKRSVCFETRHAPSLRRAVVALDMAAYSDLVSIAEMIPYVAAQMAPTGIDQARKALAWSDENSWSPQEVLMRLVWEAADRPRPLCNAPVFDRWGRHIGTPDLLDPVAGVLGEYDSALHLVGAQRTKDVRREGVFRALGLECVTMLGSDHADGHESFLSRLHTAYGAARYAAESTRQWTIQPPRWWIDTSTVESRRNLTPELQERLLRHRRAA